MRVDRMGDNHVLLLDRVLFEICIPGKKLAT